MSPSSSIGGPKPTSRLLIRPDPQDELGVYCMWIGAGGSYLIEWGDGTSDPMTATRPPKRHVYAAAGSYRIRAVRQDGHHDIAEQITVPLQPPPPAWKPEFWAGTASMAVRWPAGGPSGPWRVYWPDWEPEDHTPVEGEWLERPALPGQHTLRVVHLSSAQAHDSPLLTVYDKYHGGVAADMHIQGRTVSVRRTGPSVEDERPWWVFWGDEWSFADGATAHRPTWMVDDEATHTYAEPGIYQLEIASRWRSRVHFGVWEVTIT